MKRFKLLLAIVALATTAAHSHPGPQVWLGTVAGKLATYGSTDNLNAAPAPSSFFSQRIFLGGGQEDDPSPSGQLDTDPEVAPGSYSTIWPGFSFKTQGGIASGTTAGFALDRGLLKYNPATGHFRTVESLYSTPPQMAVATGSQIVTTNSAQRGFNFLAAPSHGHMRFVFYGNGVADVDGPAGVYALTLHLTASAAADSPPIVLLFGKEVALGTADYNAALAESPLLLALPGDANRDGTVDTLDFAKLISGFGGAAAKSWADGDFNFDGVTNSVDFNALVSHFGQSEVGAGGLPGTVVPEATFATGLTMFAFVFKRHRF